MSKLEDEELNKELIAMRYGIIGESVEYKDKDQFKQGIVLDKIVCKDHKNHPPVPVTAYLVSDVEGNIITVQHWRITKILNY